MWHFFVQMFTVNWWKTTLLVLWSSTSADHPIVQMPCLDIPATRCVRERGFAAHGDAVDVLSDAHVHPSGKELFLPCHTQDAHMLHALVNVTLPVNLWLILIRTATPAQTAKTS